MFCPQCQAEYREGFAVCADCEVPLVAELSAAKSAGQSDEDKFSASEQDDAQNPFCKFWEGSDARICADLCSVLDEAEIPHRILRQEAHLFRITPNSYIKIGVPFSLYEKAEQAVVRAFGGEQEAQRLLRPSQENRPEFDALVRQSLRVKWEEHRNRSPLAAWFPKPEDEEPEDSSMGALPEKASTQYKDELTREIWRGDVAELGEFLQSCLRENKIACFPAPAGAEIRLLVSEHDEARAREVVREVLEGTPPAD